MASANTPLAVELPHKAYILPDAIPLWPPAWWAWPVLFFILALIVLSFVLIWKRHQKRAYRREAIKSLNTIQELSDKDCILLCHELIRRCLVSEGKTSLASLPSELLYSELDKGLSAKYQFTQLGDNFTHGPYQQNITLTLEQRNALVDVTHYWIRKHHA